MDQFEILNRTKSNNMYSVEIKLSVNTTHYSRVRRNIVKVAKIVKARSTLDDALYFWCFQRLA